MTVARTVERIVKQRPFLEEALRQGIVNNAALAEQLIPDRAEVVLEGIAA